MTTNSKTNSSLSVITISINELVLTPVSCALLVNEVMKNLLYQRSQIPYPYAWLKSVVNKKRQTLEGSSASKNNFTLNRHFKIVSNTYDSVENIMNSIISIFKNFGEKLKEINFSIGVTPVCVKEVITIRFNEMAGDHIEGNHAKENSKKQPKILRSIFLENRWMDLISTSITCCNTYLFVKLVGSNESLQKLDDTVFIPSKPLFVPDSVKHTIIDFKYNTTKEYLCCDNLEIFKDIKDSSQTDSNDDVTESNCTEVWLQSRILIQGFRDCFINKVSACELW